jgi:L-ascorbate metabolism protein UlaG (beta-lactamase superfamily)
MEIKYLGQSCFYITTMGKTILVDPMISPNPLASAINVSDLKADVILLTHGHYDHVADALEIAKNSNSTLIAIYEVATWYENNGITVHSMNIGGKFSFDFGTLKMVSAIHSGTMPDGTGVGAAAGFVLWNDEACIYIAGDTALTMDMQLIPITCPKLDMAILPIGDNYTMGFEDASLASDFIKCDTIVGCHFDTFPWIKIDHQKAIDHFKQKNKTLILPKIGESIKL